MKNSELSISPVEEYNAPEIPTFENDNSTMLKKMPRRWRRKLKTIVGIGLIGALAFGSVNTFERSNQHYINHNLGRTIGSTHGLGVFTRLNVRLHTGGMGSSFYMAHLTEHEAFGIVQARLEAAGLNFDATPPPGHVFPSMETGGFNFLDLALMSRIDSVEFDLFDAQRGVGVTFMPCLGTSRFMMPSQYEIARYIEELLACEVNDILSSAFYVPGRHVGFGILLRRPHPHQLPQSHRILTRQLVNQVDKFIAQLQSQGILEPFPDVQVIVNSTPINVGEHPILINNLIMVPALELFEALEMEIVEDENIHRRAITATKNNLEIRAGSDGWFRITFNSGIRSYIGNRRSWRQDMPMVAHDDIILVPLQYIANRIGANISWDEDTRILNISY